METKEKIDKGTVTVKQFRGNGWLPEGHDGEFRYTHTSEFLCPQINTSTNLHVTGLTEEDEKRLEKVMYLNPGELSRYNRAYWSKFRIEIKKGGITLDLNNPMDELKYLVLRAHQHVANSESEKRDSPFARYVITSPEQEARANNKVNKLKKKARKISYEMSTDECVDFLKVYGQNPGKGASVDFIEDSMEKVIDENPQLFLDIVEGGNYKTIVFINKCLEANLLKKQGSKYSLYGQDIIGHSLEDTVRYLNAAENQEVMITLKNRLELDK